MNDGGRLAALGYRQELSRVLSLFDNFAVAFSYLSPMVGVYSLYALGLGTGGPRYIWTIPIVVGLMMLVALVFGELASEYPLSGALYQYGKYSVGPRYGWFIGWIYGFALLATVASVDSGAVGYVTSLSNIWFRTHLDPASHVTIFVITGAIIVVSAIANSIGAKIMGRVARFGVYVETVGTFGVFAALAIFGFHQTGVLFSRRKTSSISRATRSGSTSAATGGPARRWSPFSLTSTSSSASSRRATSPKRRSMRRDRFPRRCETRCSTAASRRSSWCWVCFSRRRRAASVAP